MAGCEQALLCELGLTSGSVVMNLILEGQRKGVLCAVVTDGPVNESGTGPNDFSFGLWACGLSIENDHSILGRKQKGIIHLSNHRHSFEKSPFSTIPPYHTLGTTT